MTSWSKHAAGSGNRLASRIWARVPATAPRSALRSGSLRMARSPTSSIVSGSPMSIVRAGPAPPAGGGNVRSRTARARTVPHPRREARRLKLLLIEDDAETRDHVANGLTEEGHLVVQAASGDNGLYLAAAENFDVLIIERMLNSQTTRRGCSSACGCRRSRRRAKVRVLQRYWAPPTRCRRCRAERSFDPCLGGFPPLDGGRKGNSDL